MLRFLSFFLRLTLKFDKKNIFGFIISFLEFLYFSKSLKWKEGAFPYISLFPLTLFRIFLFHSRFPPRLPSFLHTLYTYFSFCPVLFFSSFDYFCIIFPFSCSFFSLLQSIFYPPLSSRHPFPFVNLLHTFFSLSFSSVTTIYILFFLSYIVLFFFPIPFSTSSFPFLLLHLIFRSHP